MIIVRLIGGLGNQMFQYASAKGLAELKNVPLKLDITDFITHYNLRKFELEKFCISAQVASDREMQHYKCNTQNFLFDHYLKLKKRLNGIRYQMEPHFQYWDGIKDLPEHTYLEGYWQSEKYFAAIGDVIKNEFVLKQKMSESALKYKDAMNTSTSVSIHIRRGDYVSNPDANKVHGLCSDKYYKDSIDLIKSKIDNPFFYIFSDDLNYVKASGLFDFKEVQFVDELDRANENKDIEELILMSECKHHIIANSSFSWWGAWLNKYPNKVVVAPKQWFADTSIDTTDILPANWIKL